MGANLSIEHRLNGVCALMRDAPAEGARIIAVNHLVADLAEKVSFFASTPLGRFAAASSVKASEISHDESMRAFYGARIQS